MEILYCEYEKSYLKSYIGALQCHNSIVENHRKNMEPELGKISGESIKTRGGVRYAARYEVNPFIDKLVVTTRGRRLTVARGSTLVDLKTGELDGVTEVVQVIEVDEGQFVKLFTKDLAAWFDLRKPAMRVFGALLVAIQESAIGRDLLYLDHSNSHVSSFKISKQTFYVGIDELLSKGFIARHRSAGWYFINHTMFFNGNRARFVKEYRKKGAASSDMLRREKLEASGQLRIDGAD
jgi:hypothetical protein